MGRAGEFLRVKLAMRQKCRAFLLLGFVAVIAAGVFWAAPDSQKSAPVAHRRLGAGHDHANETKADDFFGDYKALAFGMSEDDIKGGGVIILILLSLYMFLALSIVCDEYFVPALERMAEAWEVSDEVAGATLMAAGGSAPELFTSFIGTFTESSVGFGTIVGSAVFNVLFVIGMCAVFSTGELKLTSWPLARDASYYCLSLLVLAIFFGVLSKDEIMIYEAAILFGMYFGYVMIMKNNESLHQKYWSSPAKVQPDGESKTDDDAHDPHGHHNGNPDGVNFNSPFTFRAGLLSYMVGKSTADLAGAYAVTKIKGTMKQTFALIDNSNHSDGKIDKEELGVLLEKVTGAKVTPQVLDETMTKLDSNKSGNIDIDEFKVWYTGSAHLVKRQIHHHFEDLIIEGHGLLDKKDTEAMLKRMGVEGKEIEKAEKEAHAEAKWDENDRIDREAFTDWFIQSAYLDKAMADNAEPDEGASGDALEIKWPEAWSERFWFIIVAPLMFSLYFTVPDVRNPQYKDRFVMSFVLSIVWIGVYSYVMVAWITLTGNCFGIPVAVMGLTFLAAGTSIPDLLSSVIVAKKGLGDMAVSSSIGSNIFDVLVGLPFPWLCYAIYLGAQDKGWGVKVVADTLFLSLLILFLMIGFVIALIVQQKWVMTKALGYMMFALYVVFVAQDLFRTYN